MTAAALATAQATPVRPARTIRAGLGPACLATGLFAWLALQQLLLWRFLGFGPAALGAGTFAFAGILAAVYRLRGWTGEAVPWGTLSRLFAVSLVIFILGGEARLLYANTDWQVRNAVLRDLVAYPWPFTYAADGGLLLRLPLGLYLVPSVAGKLIGQRGAEVAMLLQNSVVLCALLGIARGLFARRRARLIALVVVVGFSGMDAIGAVLTGRPLVGHLEGWASGFQFSSTITQAFWAPQHGLAGWIGAVLYLLWVDQRAPAAAALAALPLLALLSPFGLVGTLPFAAHVGASLLRERRVGLPEVLLPAAAAVLAVPSILYLSAAGATVGGAFEPPRLADYLVFELLEVSLPIYAVWRVRNSSRFGGVTLVITAAVLMATPFGRVGTSVDFIMRASIPALLVLAVALADLIASPADRIGRGARWCAVTALLIGLVTPANEIWRALSFPRAPAMMCSYLGVVPGGAATYVARLASVSRSIRPSAPTAVIPHDPTRCWASPWPDPLH